MKKVGKITRPFRYDQNQIPYDYTVKATNNQGLRFDTVPDKLCMDGGSWHCIGGSDQDHAQGKEK